MVNTTGIGASLSVTYNSGDFSFSGGLGIMSNSNYNGFGKSGMEIRKSILASYDDGGRGVSIGTNFWSGDFKQRTGLIGFRSGKFNMMYENDGGIGIKHLRLGDRGDSYRTAALNLSWGDYKAGFNLFTGARPRSKQSFEESSTGINYKDRFGVNHTATLSQNSGMYRECPTCPLKFR